MSVQVLHLTDGQDWVAEVISVSGKEYTIKCPMRLLIQRGDSSRPDDVKVSMVPALFFADDPQVELTVTVLYPTEKPEKDLVQNYQRLTGNIITPQSGLILG